MCGGVLRRLDGRQRHPRRLRVQRRHIHDRVGVDGDRLHVNVTIEQVDPDATGDARFRTVCTDDDTDGVTHNGMEDCNEVSFAVGDVPTDRDSIVVARRIVTIPDCEFGTGDGTCDATLKVRVW